MKKIVLIIGLVIALAAAGVGAFFFFHKKDTGEYVTVAQWDEMLLEHTECGSVAHVSGYVADDLADAKYISVTAMRTVDSHKYSRFLDDIDSYTDEDYFELAKQYGLLAENKKKYTKEECEAALDRYNEIYFGDLWVDDYCKAELSEGVVEAQETFAFANEDYTTVAFVEATSYAPGTVLIYTDSVGVKRCGRVESQELTGEYHMSVPELTEVVESIDLSDKFALSGDDFMNYISPLPGSEEVVVTDGFDTGKKEGTLVGTNGPVTEGACALYSEILKDSEPYHFGKSSEGVSLSVSVENADEGGKQLKVEIENKNTDESFSYKHPIDLDSKAGGSLKLDLSNINIAADTTYFKLNVDEPRYAELYVSMDTKVTGGITLSTSKKAFRIPICNLYIPLESGLVYLKTEVALQLSAEGEAKVTLSFPTDACIRYVQGEGFSKIKTKERQASGIPEISAKATFEAEFAESINLLGTYDLIKVGAAAGAVAKAEYIERENGMKCADFSVYYPVIRFFAEIGEAYEYSYDVISWEDAPYHIPLGHYETGVNVESKWVDECTYGKEDTSEDTSEEATEATEAAQDVPATPADATVGNGAKIIYGHNLYSQFAVNNLGNEMVSEDPESGVQIWKSNYDITDTGSGWILTGTLTVYNRVDTGKYQEFISRGLDTSTTEQTDESHVSTKGNGESMTHLGITYTIDHYETNVQGRGTCYMIGSDGNQYVVGNDISPQCDPATNDFYLNITCDGENKEFVIENAQIFVPYDHKMAYAIELLKDGNANSVVGMDVFYVKLDAEGNTTDILFH